jgi:hypothetical protein
MLSLQLENELVTERRKCGFINCYQQVDEKKKMMVRAGYDLKTEKRSSIMGIYYKEKATQHLAEIHYLEASAAYLKLRLQYCRWRNGMES